MRSKLISRNQFIFLGDAFLIIFSALAAYVLRLNFGERLGDFRWQILTMIGIALVVKPLVYYEFGLYRRVWAYASILEVRLIAIAVTLASMIMFVIISIVQVLRLFPEFSRGAVIIDWLISIVAVGGLRFTVRVLADTRVVSRATATRPRRVLIVGAGDAGALVVREMQKNPAGLRPICFLDDDPTKQKQDIHGVRVAGMLKDLTRVVDAHRIEEVIIAIPSAPGSVIRIVAGLARAKNIPFRTIPGLHELIGGKVSVNRLREVDITDLLRREPVHIDDQLVGESLNGKHVLVTGAGGSIGRELCRQVARWEPSQLILLGHGENSIFEILLELQELYPSMLIRPVIADIRDRDRIQTIFNEHRPRVIFHTAAHKHVPLMQINVPEAITNNILGTQNVVEAALLAEVDRLVMISSDKAVCPTSVYGATKRMAEMLVLDAARRTGKAFSVVRFGNVLGSRGSIIPLFKRQIAQGGPVTITHPDMRRYFMTIPEAVHLVLQAFAMGRGREVFVLNMGEQIRILDLAEDLIRLSGLEPGKDIEITYTGVRPGEKLSEALWDEGATYQPTGHPDVLRLDSEDTPDSTLFRQSLDQLAYLAQRGDDEALIAILDQVIPGAAIRITPTPDLTTFV